MLIPSGEGEGMVNSQLVTQGNFNSPSCGLAVVVKKKEFLSLEAPPLIAGICFSPPLLNHDVENEIAFHDL